MNIICVWKEEQSSFKLINYAVDFWVQFTRFQNQTVSTAKWLKYGSKFHWRLILLFCLRLTIQNNLERFVNHRMNLKKERTVPSKAQSRHISKKKIDYTKRAEHKLKTPRGSSNFQPKPSFAAFLCLVSNCTLQWKSFITRKVP